MADFEFPADAEVIVHTIRDEPTTVVRVRNANFGWFGESTLIGLEYGNGTGADFVSLRKEVWVFSGTYLETALGNTYPGTVIIVIQRSVSNMIIEVLGDQRLMDILLNTGELEIVAGRSISEIPPTSF